MPQSRTRVGSVTVRERTQLAKVAETRRSAAAPQLPEPPVAEENIAKPLGFGERMLRNTAVCVALLLTVMAVQSLNTPVTNGATNLLAQVVSMDLSESLGNLRFVANLLPESAEVFWNLGAERYALPTDAAVVHAFSEDEPWTGYAAGEVKAAAPGEVMSLAVDAIGRGAIRIRHESGMETLYDNLLSTSVREGDWVETGDVLGAARALVYELRIEGRPTDPKPYQR